MERARWAAFGLLGVTVLYNVGEGLVATISGLRAHSLTLVAFGGDSYIEVLAAAVVIWRLSFADEEQGERAEQRAMRFIGGTFIVLSAAIVFQAVHSLVDPGEPRRSLLGLGVLLASVIVMPALSLLKLRVAASLKMPALAAEAKETVACSYLSLTALLGLAAFAMLGWWWLDAVTALFMVPWLLREGWEGIRMEACFEDMVPCFCRACLFGLRDCRSLCCVPACC